MKKASLSELRTVYIDPDLDDALRAQATARTGGRNTLFVRWIERGMASVETLPTNGQVLSDSVLVLCTMCIPVNLDDALRNQAYCAKVPRNDLVRRYLRAGMELEQAKAA